MSTSLSHSAPESALPAIPETSKVAIVTAEWNAHITEALTKGRLICLRAVT